MSRCGRMQEKSGEIWIHCLNFIGCYQFIIDAVMYIYKFGIKVSNNRGFNMLVQRSADKAGLLCSER